MSNSNQARAPPQQREATAAHALVSPSPVTGASPISSSACCSNGTCPTHEMLKSAQQRVAELEANMTQMQSENQLLRASSGGSQLNMAFKLMDALKAERDSLKRENQTLKERIAIGAGQTTLEQLLQNPELSPSSRQSIQSLPPRLQATLAADLHRWNLRAPTDAHGNPFDINRRAQHIAKKLKEGQQAGAAAPAQGTASQPSTSSATARGAPTTASQKLHTAAPAISATSSSSSSAAVASQHPPSRQQHAHAPPNNQLSQTSATKDAHLEPLMTEEEKLADEASNRKPKKIVVAGSKAAIPSSSAASASSGSTPGSATGKSSTPATPLTAAEKKAAADAASLAVWGTTSVEEFDEDDEEDVETQQNMAAEFAQSPASLSSTKPSSSPTASPGASSSTDEDHLSTSLLSDTNRLIFQEDSPLYRQQLQVQRVRVAQMFSRLDHLSEKTSDFASAAITLAQAAEELANQLLKSWDDIETKEVIDEHEAIKMDAAAKAASSTPLSPSGAKSPNPASNAALNASPLSLGSPSVPPPASSAAAATAGSSAAAGSSSSASSSSSAASATLPTGTPSLQRNPTFEGSDPISLGFSMSKLGSILSCLSQVSNNLGLFIEHLLVTSINSIGDRYRAEAKSSMLRMERIMNEYEEKLGIYLKKKHKDRLKLLNMTNIFGKKKMIDEELMYICALRREMELRRLDHVECLNKIQTSKRVELIESICASYMSFVTFFHEGDFLAQELKVEIDALQTVIPRRKRFYEAHFQEIKNLKDNLNHAALPLNLAKIFSGQACLPIGMSATDWITNMTKENASPSIVTSPPPAGSSGSATPSATSASSSAAFSTALVSNTKDKDKSGGNANNIGHASLIYTIPGIGIAASLIKPTQTQGYLRSQTRDGKNWKRRWHVLEKGQFFYLSTRAFLAPHLIANVLTCGARPCVKADMDFVFELISPTQTLLFQAESEHDMRTWVAVFANSTEYLLSLQQTRTDTEALTKNMDVKSIQLQKHVKQGLLSQLRKANPTCCECEAANPDWISINLGVMICIVCSGIHRSLGVHISKVRSIVLDDLDTELLDMMVALGNRRVNAIYEGRLPEDYDKPSPGSSREDKEEFIQNKYVKKRWLAQAVLDGTPDANAPASSLSPADQSIESQVDGAPSSTASPHSSLDECYNALWKAIEADDLEKVMTHLLQGCEVNWSNPNDHGKTALHHCAQCDSILVTEYLLQNNADPNLTDSEGRSALDYAVQFESKQCIARLQGLVKKH